MVMDSSRSATQGGLPQTGVPVSPSERTRLLGKQQLEGLLSAAAAGESSALANMFRSAGSVPVAAPVFTAIQQNRLETLAASTLLQQRLKLSAQGKGLRPLNTDVYANSIRGETIKKVDTDVEYTPRKTATGEIFEPFPQKLYRMIQDARNSDQDNVISFFPHGRAFVIHKPRVFVTEIMPKYLTTKRLSSFQRQLNLYGFKRITEGPDTGGYCHEFFINGHPELLRRIKRKRSGSIPPKEVSCLSQSGLNTLAAMPSKNLLQGALLNDSVALLQMRQVALRERARMIALMQLGTRSY